MEAPEERDEVSAAITELLERVAKLDRMAKLAAETASMTADDQRRQTFEIATVMYDTAAVIGSAGATIALTIREGTLPLDEEITGPGVEPDQHGMVWIPVAMPHVQENGGEWAGPVDYRFRLNGDRWELQFRAAEARA